MGPAYTTAWLKPETAWWLLQKIPNDCLATAIYTTAYREPEELLMMIAWKLIYQPRAYLFDHKSFITDQIISGTKQSVKNTMTYQKYVSKQIQRQIRWTIKMFNMTFGFPLLPSGLVLSGYVKFSYMLSSLKFLHSLWSTDPSITWLLQLSLELQMKIE